MTEETLLTAIQADPLDALAYRALADWLEEQGQSDRAELLRLDLRLRAMEREDADRREAETRLQYLLGAGVRPCVPALANSLGMVFHLIPAGRYPMGTPEEEEGRFHDEPLHEVEIVNPFYLGVHLVTQEQYQRVMGNNPSEFCASGPHASQVEGLDTTRFPVEFVSWGESTEFCAALSAVRAERKAKRSYRLPTEAEWEYACRAGTTTPFAFGLTLTHKQANCSNGQSRKRRQGAALKRPCPVGSYLPNAWGLHDCHGNVWEWCADWYSADYTPRGPAEDEPDSEVPPFSGYRTLRGGGWNVDSRACRAASRSPGDPNYRGGHIGVRVVCVPK